MTESIRLSAAALKPSVVALPGSKSISNRTLLLAALSDNACEIRSLLSSDDTARMLEALTSLGVKLEPLALGRIKVHGCGGRFPERRADLFLGNAGTAFRPLTAALAVLGGDYRLHGVPRMHERPIGDLVDALHIAGADVQYLGNEGYPPLQINGRSDKGARVIPIKGNVSSQFLTALLMALPLTGEAFEIRMVGEKLARHIAFNRNHARAFIAAPVDLQRRIAFVAPILHIGTRDAQRIHQVANRALVHARHAVQPVIAAEHRQRCCERAKSRAGVAEK